MVAETTIVVTPTFYSPVEGVEVTPEQCQDVIAELGEENYVDIDGLYTWYFQYEIRNEIIPMIESKYSTYAGGDVSEANLIATREHRAYDGLSMGSITSTHSILMGNMDYFAYVGSFSGMKTNPDLFINALNEKYSEYEMKYWYNGNGVDDIAFQEHYDTYYELMDRMPEKFTDGENCAMVVFADGKHVFSAWISDIYNSLLVFFKK